MIEREIGQHDEAIKTLKDEVKGMRADIAEIKTILASAKGSWKTLIAIGSIGGALGVAAMKVLSMLKGLG